MANAGTCSVMMESALQFDGKQNCARIDLPLLKAFFVEAGSDAVCMLGADLCVINRQDTLIVRRAVADRLKMDWTAVHVYVTHTHAPASLRVYDLERLTDLAVGAAVSARDALIEVDEVGFLSVDTKGRYNINRRTHGGGMGAWCLMQSTGCKDDGMTVDGTEWARMRLCKYGANEEEVRLFTGPCLAGSPTDSDLDMVLFRGRDGGNVAGIVRFAAHAVICSGGYWKPNLNRDYPGVLCDSLADAFQCPFMFVQGPCADLRPRHQDVGLAERDRIGKGLASELIADKRCMKLMPFDRLRNTQATIAVPIRREVPLTMEAAEDAWRNAVRELKAVPHGSLDALRMRKKCGESEKLLDKIRNVEGFLDYLTLEERMKRQAELPVSMVEFGDVRLLQFPGEMFSGSISDLKLPDGRPLVVASYVDGVVGYMVPLEEFERGGYEPTSALLDPDAALVLSKAGEGLLHGKVGNMERLVDLTGKRTCEIGKTKENQHEKQSEFRR